MNLILNGKVQASFTYTLDINHIGRRVSMARSKDSYIIKVHYPETEEDIFEIRRRMGSAYTRFLKDYVLALPISDEEKNNLYEKVLELLKEQ